MSQSPDYSQQVRFWLDQIEASQKARKDYYERGQKVQERYMDEKRLASQSDGVHRMNVLWSNVQTIQPALYAKTPNPKVQRRYRDKDPVGKWGAIVIERSLGFSFDAYDVDYHIRQSILDYLLPGCGQIWVSYEPQTEGEGPQERIVWEKCNADHLNWKDYLSSVSRTSDEDWWRARRVYLTKEQVEAQEAAGVFTKGISSKLSFSEDRDENKGGDSDKSDRIKKVPVWEIWNKAHGKRHFVSKSCPDLLGEGEPPHKFDGFFPCPRPLLATTTSESTIPQADFYLYQDQANEIDRLTQRINVLTDALKVIGVYSAPLEGEDNVFSTLLSGSDNKMVPVKNWAMFAQAGGFDGAVDFFPLKDVITTLNECYTAREQAKASMYEITGISDIVRGASDPNETARAQQIKSQWGSLRIRDRQAEVQRFVRDVMRLKSEIIAERYQLQTLKAMTNCPLLMQAEKQQLQQRQQMQQQAQQLAQQNPEQAQIIAQANPQLAQQIMQPLSPDELQRLREPTWEEVYQLLRDERLRSYRIDIETDSTILNDEVAEKQARTEFMTAFTGYVQAWGPMVMQFPKIAPLFAEGMRFTARAFKQSESLESEIDALADMLSQMAMMPQPPAPPDPKVEAEKQKMEAERQKGDFERQRMELDMQMNGEKQQFEREKMQHDREQMSLQAQGAREDRAFKLQERQVAAQEKVETAKANRPSVDELSAIMGPIAQFLQQLAKAQAEFMDQMAETNAQSQSQMARAVSDLANAAQQMAVAASAPRDIVVTRDKQGRVSGGSSNPRMN